MQDDYLSLGLSETDVSLLKKYNLIYLLDKIRDQQSQLEEQRAALENALSKIRRDLSSAREAQMSMLPMEFHAVPEVEFHARFYPSQYVSGDIYNIFRLDEKHVGLYHIDISGHGVPAALFSVSLSQMLNTNISTRNLLKVPAKEPPYYKINPPVRVIEILNEEQSFERCGIFFTMIYMIINLQDGLLRYTRAGHNPPIILRTDGSVEYPQAGGFPIGWNFPRDDENIELRFNPGDRIYLFSDGITEAANAEGELFSADRLQKILQKNRSRLLAESLDAVIRDLKQHTCKNDFEDDVSIVGVSWNGKTVK
jgi:sigma-B regulation protein RsbU (phosphoserine phosphatase)